MITYPGPKFPFVAQAGNPPTGRPRSEHAPAERTIKVSPGAGLLNNRAADNRPNQT